MIKRNTIFDLFANMMIIFGISVLCLCLFVTLFGESARGYSTMFVLGSEGLTVKTLLQFFGMCASITFLRWLFFTDVIIKELNIPIRMILMIFCIILVVAIFAGTFGWFPVNHPCPWIGFFVSFGICTVIGTGVSVLKEKSENKKMQDALERLKEEEA